MKMEKNTAVTKHDPNMRHGELNGHRILWHDPKDTPFQVNGFAWFEKENSYRRLPSQPAWEIRQAVDELSNHTSGGQIRFKTNAKVLAVKVKLTAKADMSHMPASGQCGFDCYIGNPGKKHFINITRYDHTQQEYELTFFERTETTPLPITLNFPLYQGVEEVLVGVNQDAQISPPPPYDSQKKIILYGTSILQGGCASRPGMSYSNIMSRKINLEFINLGFSGNGQGDSNLAKLISTIEDPACLVLDYEPNCISTEKYKETLPAFIRIYRKKHPFIPIVVVSKFPYAGEAVNPQLKVDRLERLVFQKNLIQQLQSDGDRKIIFVDGTDMLGNHTNEGTVDGVHPNDLGFMAMAEKMLEVLQGVLGE
ncbi:lysophospholipase L1-like esterase [Bacillus tianshenii]|uniref:Lysophospholipase L1-like esterase n=1 Tax=Sutcliffiella tianshenii TaxID=1463404 RepID=A0ABS2NVF7_9BACI|nr:SGNH/GDSL hydrolase family protein [Bacillus tianshenii]MBM7618467.1 lysophospholipase L1-like esterase [Bacillus tianshenii]